jgi:hypothetical protein
MNESVQERKQCISEQRKTILLQKVFRKLPTLMKSYRSAVLPFLKWQSAALIHRLH